MLVGLWYNKYLIVSRESVIGLIKLQVNSRTTAIDNEFIDRYMNRPDSAVFSLIYIYALRCAIAGIGIENKVIADKFQILESDVVKAWRYWEKEGILALHKNKGEYIIEFLNIGYIEESVKKEAAATAIPKMIIETKPTYNPRDISKYSQSNPEVQELFGMAQVLLGKTLSSNDLSTLFGLYDWLGLSLEVIAVLLTYCGKNRKPMRYIEKTAIDWVEKGINTSEDAENYLNMYYSEYKEILDCFGIKNRMATDDEKGYMNGWLKKYRMPLEVIKVACNKTVNKTGQVSFPYADKIIQNWAEKNIRSVEDVEKQEMEFGKRTEEKKTNKKSTAIAGNQQKTNKFINYEQRSYNPEELKKLEKIMMNKDVKGQ